MNTPEFKQKRVMPSMSKNVIIFAMSDGDVNAMFAMDALFTWNSEKARSAIERLDRMSIYGIAIASMWSECEEKPDNMYAHIQAM